MGILNFVRNVSPVEWVVLLVILFLLFGGKIFSAFGRMGGETFKEIKKVKKSFMEAVEEDESTTGGKKDKEVDK